MSSDIAKYRDGGICRRAGRELSQIGGYTVAQVARVESRADIQAAQVDAMTAVTQRGLQAAAYITTVEMSLGEACPAAMTRLKQVGDTGTAAIAGIVIDTALKLRRL